MSDSDQLPYLLDLLDDDSDLTRAELRREFARWGDKLKIAIARLNKPLSPAQRATLQELMRESSRARLRERWSQWFPMGDELPALEAGLSQLSDALAGYLIPTDLAILLDDLGDEYRKSHPRPDALSLATFLFKEKALRGNVSDYDNPLNSALAWVITERKGIPLSLACVYMLVGMRVGLDIQGCNFPGHFLARVQEGERTYLVDCFNGGIEVDHKVVAQMSESTPWSVQAALNAPAGARAILGRALRNLARSFRQGKREDDETLMEELSLAMERSTPLEPQTGPKFRTGQILRHRALGFRAVIVDFDLSCKAPEAWLAVQAPSARLDQPWYHLFVDNSEDVAYAPEAALAPSQDISPLQHPLLNHFFEKLEDGKYWRNARRWPGAD